MRILHGSIQREYESSGEIRQRCLDSALAIVQSLIRIEHKSPEIREYRIKGAVRGNEPLFIVREYERSSGFWYHAVCVCDGLVYEPLFNREIPEDQYPSELSDATLEHEVLHTVRELQAIFLGNNIDNRHSVGIFSINSKLKREIE